MQLVFSLHKGPKNHVRSLITKSVNGLGEMGLYHVFCFTCFYHTYKPGVIKTLTDTEFFPATLEQENNDWSFIISVLVQRHFLLN